jgi:hypothetical protein
MARLELALQFAVSRRPQVCASRGSLLRRAFACGIVQRSADACGAMVKLGLFDRTQPIFADPMRRAAARLTIKPES